MKSCFHTRVLYQHPLYSTHTAGFDSVMLNHYKELKDWSQRTGCLPNVFSSLTGYCITLVFKTLPSNIFRSSHKLRVRVINMDPEALWVDHRRGDFVQKAACRRRSDDTENTNGDDDGIVFEGEASIVAAGTAPYYGGGLRLFPFARLTLDKMHLRIGRIHPVRGFFQLPAIWAGSYRDKSDRFGALDFIGADFEIQVLKDGGFPFQHSGESIDRVESFRLRVVDEPVRFRSLLKERDQGK